MNAATSCRNRSQNGHKWPVLAQRPRLFGAVRNFFRDSLAISIFINYANADKT
jgi:hypothetical protein